VVFKPSYSAFELVGRRIPDEAESHYTITQLNATPPYPPEILTDIIVLDADNESAEETEKQCLIDLRNPGSSSPLRLIFRPLR
jgi:hypothetical protein